MITVLSVIRWYKVRLNLLGLYYFDTIYCCFFLIGNKRVLFKKIFKTFLLFCSGFQVLFVTSLLAGLLAFLIMLRMAITQTLWEMSSFLGKLVLKKKSLFPQLAPAILKMR